MNIAPTEKPTAITARKFFAKSKPKAQFISCLEFHQQIGAVRACITDGSLALGRKLYANHRELLSVLELQRTTFDQRLNAIEANLARLDQRTAPRKR